MNFYGIKEQRNESEPKSPLISGECETIKMGRFDEYKNACFGVNTSDDAKFFAD
jgi:hypothetical protein